MHEQFLSVPNFPYLACLVYQSNGTMESIYNISQYMKGVCDITSQCLKSLHTHHHTHILHTHTNTHTHTHSHHYNIPYTYSTPSWRSGSLYQEWFRHINLFI